MNYKSQLKGWGIDRAIEFHKVANTEGLTLDTLLSTAEKLTASAYIPDEDFADAVRSIGDLIKASTDPLANVEQLIGELSFLKEQIEAQAKKIQPIGKAN